MSTVPADLTSGCLRHVAQACFALLHI